MKKQIVHIAFALLMAGISAGCSSKYEEPEDFIRHYFVDHVMEKYEDEIEKYGPFSLEIKNIKVEATVNPDVDIIRADIQIVPKDGTVFYYEDGFSEFNVDRVTCPYNISSNRHKQIKDYIDEVKKQCPKGMAKYKTPLILKVATGRRKNKKGRYEPVRFENLFRGKSIWVDDNLDAYFIPTRKKFMSGRVLEKSVGLFDVESSEYIKAKTRYNQRVEKINKKLAEISGVIDEIKDMNAEWRRSHFVKNEINNSIASYEKKKRICETRMYAQSRARQKVISQKEKEISNRLKTINNLKVAYADYKSGKRQSVRYNRTFVRKLPNGREQIERKAVMPADYPTWIADLEQEVSKLREDVKGLIVHRDACLDFDRQSISGIDETIKKITIKSKEKAEAAWNDKISSAESRLNHLTYELRGI